MTAARNVHQPDRQAFGPAAWSARPQQEAQAVLEGFSPRYPLEGEVQALTNTPRRMVRPETLPEGWYKLVAPPGSIGAGHPYYCNEQLQISQWEQPW